MGLFKMLLHVKLKAIQWHVFSENKCAPLKHKSYQSRLLVWGRKGVGSTGDRMHNCVSKIAFLCPDICPQWSKLTSVQIPCFQMKLSFSAFFPQVLTQGFPPTFLSGHPEAAVHTGGLRPEALNKGSGRSLLVSSPSSFDFQNLPHLLIWR